MFPCESREFAVEGVRRGNRRQLHNRAPTLVRGESRGGEGCSGSLCSYCALFPTKLTAFANACQRAAQRMDNVEEGPVCLRLSKHQCGEIRARLRAWQGQICGPETGMAAEYNASMSPQEINWFPIAMNYVYIYIYILCY